MKEEQTISCGNCGSGERGGGCCGWWWAVGLGLLVVITIFKSPFSRVNWGRMSMVPVETVSVTGRAKSQNKTQIAQYSAGVSATKDKKDEAVKEVNTKVSELIEAVKKFGIKAEDIKTQSLSIYQQQENYWEDGKQKMRPGQWTVNNSVEIKLREVEQASKLADLLAASGANNVYGPSFQFDDVSQIEKTLFDGAMKDAVDKAEIVARASGRKLGKVISVSENGGLIYGYSGTKMEGVGLGGGGAPVEPGSETVSKSLGVVFELE